MQAGRAHDVKHLKRCILLQVFVSLYLRVAKTCYHLCDTEPELLVHVIARELNQFNDHIDVPAEINREFLGEDSDLEHHHLRQFVIIL